MTGTLYGVGVGPGDPELLTLKAVRLVRENPVIAVPGTKKDDSVAYKIVRQAVPELEEKEVLAIPMPMIKDKELLAASHDAGAAMVISYLKQGQNVVFLTLGDPTVYATYMYIHQRVEAAGYDTQIVSGIPSFCAVAARLNRSLVETSQMLHVVPSSYQIDEALKMPGTKVLMKAGKQMKHVKEKLMATEQIQVAMIENCGMENEKIYESAEAIDENAGYYSLIIVKEDVK